MKKSRILSKKDELSHRESLAVYKHFRQDTRSGLIVPIDHVDHRDRHCGYCGKAYTAFTKTGYYYDEKFHLDCIQKMLNGETNQ